MSRFVLRDLLFSFFAFSFLSEMKLMLTELRLEATIGMVSVLDISNFASPAKRNGKR